MPPWRRLRSSATPRAPREIWRRYAPLVRRIVRRTLGPEHDVEGRGAGRVLSACSTSCPGCASLCAARLPRLHQRAQRALRAASAAGCVAWSASAPRPRSTTLRVVSVDHESRQALSRLYSLLDRMNFRERTAFVLRFVEAWRSRT
jgi:RNA polymerase sigma-70 factor (ECF subfamily)